MTLSSNFKTATVKDISQQNLSSSEFLNYQNTALLKMNTILRNFFRLFNKLTKLLKEPVDLSRHEQV